MAIELILQAIGQWKERLIDLSRRNRLLYFRPSKSSSLFISYPDPEAIFRRLVVAERGWRFWYPPEEEESIEESLFPGEDNPPEEHPEAARFPRGHLVCEDLDREQLERILKRLLRRANTEYLERGIRVLHVAFGMLAWRETQTSDEVRSPLILVPVGLSRESATDPFEVIPTGEDPVLNPALQVRLRRDFNIELPTLPSDWDMQELSSYFDAVVAAGGHLEWTVQGLVLLGFFSFHKLPMYQDLDSNATLAATHPIVSALAGQFEESEPLPRPPGEAQLDDVEVPEKTFQAFDADSSQRVCIQAVLQGHDMVIQGPPGTGKSQTICNLICESIARQKTVLFVSEKMAALEVVYARLGQLGLDDFCLDLYRRRTRRETVQELARCLQERPAPTRLPSPTELERLLELRTELNAYVNALHRQREPMRLSAYQGFGILAELDSYPTVLLDPLDPQTFTPEWVQKVDDMLLRLSTLWLVVEEGEEFPWRGYSGEFRLETPHTLRDLLGQILLAVTRLTKNSGGYSSSLGLDEPSTLGDVDWLLGIAQFLDKSPRPLRSWFDQTRRVALVEEANNQSREFSSYRATRQSLHEQYGESVFQLPAKIDRDVETAWHELVELLDLGQRDREGKLLLRERRRLKQFADETVQVLEDLRRNAEPLAETRPEFSVDLPPRRLGRSARKAWLSSRLRAVLFRVSMGRTPRSDEHISARHILRLLGTWKESLLALETLGSLAKPSGRSIPLLERPMSAIKEWARAVASQAEPLCSPLLEAALRYKPGTPLDLSSLLEDLCQLSAIREFETEIEAGSSSLEKRFGERYQGLDTRWGEIQAALEWTGEVVEHFGTRPIPSTFIDVAGKGAEAAPPANQLRGTYEELISLLGTLGEFFGGRDVGGAARLLAMLTLDSVAQRVDRLRQRIDDLETWVDYCECKEGFAKVGLAEFFEALVSLRPDRSRIVNIFHKALYQQWLNSVLDQDPRLGKFRGQHHQQVVERFRDLDRRLVSLSNGRVIQEANQLRPKEYYSGAPDAEINVLLREAAKKRRHLPLRQLFARIPNLLLRLKPCLMMNPLQVRQFLSPDRKFDLVVFDEASQIYPEDAIGAIYRGRQLVVAGDNKQLPPTSFFHVAELDDYYQDDIEGEEFPVYESILDACTTIDMYPAMLRWHYRSRHESLIAYSNSSFYDNRLVTFPAAQRQSAMLGVDFVYVDGIYDRGGKRTNQREAEAVVDLIFEHFDRHPDRTLAIIALSLVQAYAIEDEKERRLVEMPRRDRERYAELFNEFDRVDGLKIQNLENMQGDERDVVILSIGYGRDPQGRMTMNFGPLNWQGGERRLNVAITRARERVILVSSIRASDIDLNRARSAGVRHLHRYLDYAERGEQALQLAPYGDGSEFESPLEEDVAAEITRLGFQVVPQVGCSGYRIDIGVVDPGRPGRFLLGVECDGARYHSSHTARDRDRLRQQVLESLGWRIHRVWAPDWVRRRTTEIERIQQILEETRQNPGGESKEEEDTDNPDHEATAPAEIQIVRSPRASVLPGTVPYRVSDLLLLRSLTASPLGREEAWRLLAQLVQEEGPVHVDHALRRLARVYSVKRVTRRFKAYFRWMLSECVTRGEIRQRREFLWPTEQSQLSVRIPVAGVPESRRAIHHIAPEEIQAAMCLVAKHAVGIGVDSLLLETARVLGFKRMGRRIRNTLSKAHQRLEKKGTLRRSGQSVTLATD